MAATVITADTVNQSAHNTTGLTPVMLEVEVPTTSLDEDGDVVLLFKFGPNAKLPVFINANVLTIWTDDLDSGTDSDIDFGLSDSDGVLDTTLISGGSIGQAATAAAGVAIDAGVETLANQGYVDCSDKYLAMRQTAATAGATAGTVKVSMLYVNGVVANTSDET